MDKESIFNGLYENLATNIVSEYLSEEEDLTSLILQACKEFDYDKEQVADYIEYLIYSLKAEEPESKHAVYDKLVDFVLGTINWDDIAEGFIDCAKDFYQTVSE